MASPPVLTMNFCDDHWLRLRSAIDERGMSSLVSDSTAELARRVAREADTGPSIDSFDPLMGAHMAICANALRIAEETNGSPAAAYLLSTRQRLGNKNGDLAVGTRPDLLAPLRT